MTAPEKLDRLEKLRLWHAQGLDLDKATQLEMLEALTEWRAFEAQAEIDGSAACAWAFELGRTMPTNEITHWLASAVGNGWSVGDFTGPCEHGRDPYTRCDYCEDLSPRAAFVRLISSDERELCARVAEEWSRNSPELQGICSGIAERIRRLGG